MAIKRTRWKPDTCGCVIEFEWDDSLPIDNRVHTPHSVESCQFHSTGALEEKYETVVNENKKKNLFLKKVLDSTPSLRSQTREGDFILEDGATYDFYFDENRVLHTTFRKKDGTKLSKQEIDAIDADIQSDQILKSVKLS